MKHPAHQYALDVSKGKVPACTYVKKACSRYLQDLKQQKKQDLVFKEATATAYLLFFEKALRHTVGTWAGKPFELLPWQQWVLWNIYGWYRKDGTRRFNYVYLGTSRKQGKTTLLAGMALAALLFDEEPAGEVYLAATKRDQAKIAFNEAYRMVQYSPALKKVLESKKHEILNPGIQGRLTYLASDSNHLDGLNVHFAGIDEYHAHSTDEVSNVLKSGMQARTNPLHVIITTAGLNKKVPCYKQQLYCKEVLDGTKQDNALFTAIWELDPTDSWNDPESWYKANPSLGATVTLEALQKQYQQAVNMGGSSETEFKTKHLNTWVTSSKTWIPADVWQKNAIATPPNLQGRQCWAGMDLASVSDITALVFLWPLDNEEFYIEGQYWLPADTVEAVLEQNPGHIYADFIKLPNMHLTEGNVTDYASIRRLVSGVHYPNGTYEVEENSYMHQYEIQGVAFDRYNSTQIAIDLTQDGVPLAPYGQGYVSMSAPTKQLEILVRQGKIKHNGCPIMQWALGNVELRTDPAGNVKPDKGKSRSGKIDPVVSLVMALGEYMKTDRGEIGEDMLTVFSI